MIKVGSVVSGPYQGQKVTRVFPRDENSFSGWATVMLYDPSESHYEKNSHVRDVPERFIKFGAERDIRENCL